jgi:hypothetical protein
VDTVFGVRDEGRLMMDLVQGSIEFEEIEVKATGALDWLYNAIISLFHEQILGDIRSLMHQALLHDVPKTVNAYLSDVPSSVRASRSSTLNNALHCFSM